MDRFCIQCGLESDALDDDGVCPECGGAGRGEVVVSAPETVIAGSVVDVPVSEAGRSFPTAGSVPEMWSVGDVLLDLYEVGGVLGQGGMARVYRVRHQGWGIDLAVKTPLSHVLAQEGGVESFVDEAGTWVELGLHPNVVACHYVRTLGAIPRVFAELVEGGSLADWIADGRLYEGTSDEVLGRLLDVAIQFAWGLGYAHDQGLVHQDVKPANVLMDVDQDGGVTVKVADFGLAKSRVVDVEGTSETRVVQGVGGSPAYYSPEQADAVFQAAEGHPVNERVWLTRRTDVWSWAVSVLEMFVVERTWRQGNAASFRFDDYVSSGAQVPGVPSMPRGLVQVLDECFQRNPDDRPPGFDHVAGQLIDAYRQATSEPYPREQPNAAELLAPSLNNRAISFLDLGRDDEAVATLERAVEVDPGHAESVYNRAMLLWGRGEMTDEDAVAAIRIQAGMSGGSWPSWLNLALASLRRRDIEGYEEALRAADEAGAPNDELDRLRAGAPAVPGFGRCRELTSRESRIRQVEFTDTRQVVTIFNDGLVQVSDPLTGSDRSEFRLPQQLGSPFVTLLRDTNAYASSRRDGSLLVWDPDSGRSRKFKVFGKPSPWMLRKPQQSPDGRPTEQSLFGPETLEASKDLVACAAADGRVLVWDLARERSVASILLEPAEGSPELAASCDGSRLVTSTGTGDIAVWDLEVGSPNSPLVPESEPQAGEAIGAALVSRLDRQPSRSLVALSPDGTRLAFTRNFADIGLWRSDDVSVVRTLPGHATVASLLFLGDRRYLVSGGADGMLRIWDVEHGTCIRTLGPQRGRIRALAVSSDGSQLAAGTHQGDLRIWDVSGVGPLPAIRPIVSRIVSAKQMGSAQSEVDRLLFICDELMTARDWVAAAHRVREGRAVPGYERHPELLARWRMLTDRLGTGDLRDAWQSCGIHAHEDQVHSVAVSRDCTMVASGGADGTLNLWELSTGDRVESVARAHGGTNVVCLAYNRVSGILASGGGDGRVRVWEHPSLEPLAAWSVHRAPVHGLRFSPDGSTLAVATAKGRVATYDPWGSRKAKRSFLGRALYSADYSPDGRMLVSSASDRHCYVLDAETLKTISVLRGRPRTDARGDDADVNVFCAVFAPESGHVLSAGQDRKLRLWDVEMGTCLWVHEAHDNMVLECRVAKDGLHAVSVSWDGTLRVWRLDEAEPIRTFAAHAGEVQAVDMSSDAHHVVTGGFDGMVYVWSLDWELATEG